MKRPADQAKLLFLYLLRSSAAALASNSPAARASGGAANSVAADHHILLRLATRTDVPSIQRCNLATLPENYNSAFYTSHMRQWPDLCLVAEHVNHPSQTTRKRFPQYYTNCFPGSSIPPEPKIVGYVLGKVEERPVEPPFAVPDQQRRFHHHFHSRHTETELVGHVTSLAVLQTHRRCGLARALMQQLHYQLQQNKAHGVGLHVRKSNVAAARLYEQDGYVIHNVIPQYYQDGEDAYFMRKELLGEHEYYHNNEQEQWNHQDNRLPRDFYIPNPNGQDQQQEQQTGEAQISITGTL